MRGRAGAVHHLRRLCCAAPPPARPAACPWVCSVRSESPAEGERHRRGDAVETRAEGQEAQWLQGFLRGRELGRVELSTGAGRAPKKAGRPPGPDSGRRSGEGRRPLSCSALSRRAAERALTCPPPTLESPFSQGHPPRSVGWRHPGPLPSIDLSDGGAGHVVSGHGGGQSVTLRSHACPWPWLMSLFFK